MSRASRHSPLAFASLPPHMLPSDRLNDLLIDVGRSLLQYVGESWPWTSEDEADVRIAVETMVAEQRDTVLQLAGLLDDRAHRIIYGQYPSEYTSLHYVALDYLLEQLARQQQDLASDFADAAEESAGDEIALALLTHAADQARRHADELARLVATRKSRSTIVA
jgi:hypothetical protein